MADGIKEAAYRQLPDRLRAGVFQQKAVHPLIIAARIHHLAAPVHADRRIGQHPIGHGGAGPQLIAAHHQVHMAAVFGEINGLFTGGIAATDDGQLGVAELGGGPIADGTGTDAAAPEALLVGQMQTVGAGAGGQDQRLSLDRLAVGFDAEGALGEIDRLGIGLQQPGAPAQRLGLAAIHQVGAKDAVRKTRKVLDMGGGHQLATRDAPILEAGDQQGAEIGSGGVDGRRVASRARSDDHQILNLLRLTVFNRRRIGLNFQLRVAHGLERQSLAVSLGMGPRRATIANHNQTLTALEAPQAARGHAAVDTRGGEERDCQNLSICFRFPGVRRFPVSAPASDAWAPSARSPGAHPDDPPGSPATP